MSSHAYLVDDDEAIRDSLGWLLESRGVACLSYPSAEDFLADLAAFACRLPAARHPYGGDERSRAV
jgi:FixJ family two-component response regulator